jgi:hypothetical protein
MQLSMLRLLPALLGALTSVASASNPFSRRRFASSRHPAKPPHPASPWSGVTDQLDGWVLSGTNGFGFTVGNASGVQFDYTHGKFSMHQVVETASTSKWPMAMMFVGLVQDGSIASLDSYASDYVPWSVSVCPQLPPRSALFALN